VATETVLESLTVLRGSMRVVLLGAPGSGKGTQGRRLAARYGVAYLSTGEMLRDQLRGDTPLGRAARPYVDAGGLVPDELIVPAVLDELTGPQAPAGYVLDGFPRSLSQAMAAEDATADGGGLADAVVFLDVPEGELTRRLAERARDAGRADDQSVAIIERRMQAFRTRTMPLREYYEQRGNLVPIVAVGVVDEVADRIDTALDARRGPAPA